MLLEASDTNYEVAWQLLKDRFENQRVVVNNHVNALFDLPTITKESYVQLRQLIDNILNHLEALKLLSQPREHSDALIIYLIKTKLEYITKREWESESSIQENKTPTFGKMNKFLMYGT